jgi:hypothetical protein
MTKCQCTYEAGDSRCDVHPGCDYCGAEIAIVGGVIFETKGADRGRYCSTACRDRGEGPVRAGRWRKP